MKNKISFIYIRINNKLIDSYANYILDMPKIDKSRPRTRLYTSGNRRGYSADI